MSLPAGVSPKAIPLANEDLTAAILELVGAATQNKQISRGANETIKALNKNRAEFVVIAGDTDPIETVLGLPILCEDKNVPYIFITSRAALGQACNITRSVIACAVKTKDNSRLQKSIDALKLKIEQAFIE